MKGKTSKNYKHARENKQNRFKVQTLEGYMCECVFGEESYNVPTDREVGACRFRFLEVRPPQS